MPRPGEHKTVQARILAYAQEIGWTCVPRGEAERRRGFDRWKDSPAEQAAEASPYFDEGHVIHERDDHEQGGIQTPNHGKLWKSLMRAHLGNYENLEDELRRCVPTASVQEARSRSSRR